MLHSWMLSFTFGRDINQITKYVRVKTARTLTMALCRATWVAHTPSEIPFEYTFKAIYGTGICIKSIRELFLAFPFSHNRLLFLTHTHTHTKRKKNINFQFNLIAWRSGCIHLHLPVKLCVCVFFFFLLLLIVTFERIIERACQRCCQISRTKYMLSYTIHLFDIPLYVSIFHAEISVICSAHFGTVAHRQAGWKENSQRLHLNELARRTSGGKLNDNTQAFVLRRNNVTTMKHQVVGIFI